MVLSLDKKQKKTQSAAAAKTPRARKGTVINPRNKPISVGSTVKTSTLKNSVTVRNREMLTTVKASNTGFRYQVLVNPGMFPWARQIADSYDMYVFKACKFTFVPSCPTTTPGNLVMFLDYDPQDDNSSMTPEEMSGNVNAVTTQLYETASIAFAPSRTVLPVHKYYTSDNSVVLGTGSDSRLTNSARLWLQSTLITPTAQPEVIVGKLFVEYCVEFSDPQVQPITGSAISVRAPPGWVGPTVDSVIGTVTSLIAIGKTIGSFVAGVKNLYVGLTELGGVISAAIFEATKTPDMEDLRQWTTNYMVDYPAPDSTDTATAYNAANPNATWFVYEAPADNPEFWVVLQTGGNWTSVAGAAPLLQTSVSDGWVVRQYSAGVYPSVFPAGVATTYSLHAFYHVSRTANPVSTQRKMAMAWKFTSAGVPTAAPGVNSYMTVMATPQPILDDRNPRYL